MKHTLRNLAWSNVKKDRTSSVLVLLSIFLTTVLLAVIVIIGNGLVQDNRENVGILYGDYYGSFGNVKPENIKEMKLHSEFTEIGRTALLGTADSKNDIYLYWMDDTVSQMMNLNNKYVEGSYPEKGNEIVGETSFFQQFMSGSPKVGDEIEIRYRTSEKEPYQTDTFIISGIMEDSMNSEWAVDFGGYVSWEYYKNHMPEDEQTYSVFFKLDEALGITSESAEDFIENLAMKCGVDKKYVSANAPYLMWKLNPGTDVVWACGIISFVVIIFSVIVIYNIFHVGIVRKVQEYGKLKAIGSTKKQLKRVVLYEGMTLAAVGVPLGLLVGYGLGVLSFRFLMDITQMGEYADRMQKISLFHAPLLLLAGAMSFLAVFVALKKPMKIVSAISPVEAMRYQESSENKNGIRRGKKEMGVFNMTCARLFGSRKRTFSTIISMGLSGVLFIVIANFMGNMDVEYDARRTVEHGQIEVSLDYSLDDQVYPENNLNMILKNNPFDQEAMDTMRSIKGVKKIKTRNILYGEMQDEQGKKTGKKCSIVVYDREDFKTEIKESGVKGEFDYDSVSKEQGIIHGFSYSMEENGYSIGKDVFMQIGETVDCKVPLLGAFGSAGGSFAITEDTYQAMGLEGNMTGTIWIDCDPKDVNSITAVLNNYFAGNDHVDMKTYENEWNQSMISMRMMKVMFYGFAVLIGVISFFNMANTIITSIITRKQEFGILQAIGMTNKQLNRSLQLEGILFTLGTVFISVAVGSPLGYLLFRYGKDNYWIGLHVYHFPWKEMLLMMGSIALMQAVLSFLLSRNLKKESLVDRIRYQE